MRFGVGLCCGGDEMEQEEKLSYLSIRVPAALLKRLKYFCLGIESNLTQETIKALEAHLDAHEPKKKR
jgi:hypothetical protein